jgi:uncharacterized phage-associated protein
MKAEIVVNTLLAEAMKRNKTLSNIQVQKLLYFLHGHFMAKTEKPLLDEAFEAWQYGPVVRSIYDQLNQYGNAAIKNYLPLIDNESGKENIFVVSEDFTNFWEVFDEVWSKYGNLAPFDLVAKSHEFDGPWHQVKIRYGVISNDVILDYFRKFNNE